MWAVIVQGAILLGTYAYHRWVEDHPEPPPPDRNLEMPRVNEGTPIAMVYGRCRIRQPILVWSGNYLVPGDTYSRADGGGDSVADHYSLDALFVIGIPFFHGKATLTAAWAGDTPIVSMVVGPVIGVPGAVQQFQGGPGAHGADSTLFSLDGVFYTGLQIQDVTNNTSTGSDSDTGHTDGVDYGNGLNSFVHAAAYNEDNITLLPGMKSQIVMYSHIANGTSQSIPSLSFEVQALSTDSAADLGRSLPTDADPAAVILDLMTSPWGKLAIPMSKIDLPSFNAASLTLYSEAHGYSRAIDQGADASQIIGDVLKQIDGMIYEEPTTGMIVLKLIRNDYVVSSLDDINPDNMEAPGTGWYTVQGWSETINQVRVKFTDRDNSHADGIAIGQNMANVIGQGGKLRSLELTYVGCCDRALAARLASRELGAVSRPVAKATVVVNRSFYAHRPGDAVTLTWPELGISKMVMRIVRVDLGQLHDGRIKIDMIRDVFDVRFGAFNVAVAV